MTKIYFGVAGNRLEQNKYRQSKSGRQNQHKQNPGVFYSRQVDTIRMSEKPARINSSPGKEWILLKDESFSRISCTATARIATSYIAIYCTAISCTEASCMAKFL